MELKDNKEFVDSYIKIVKLFEENMIKEHMPLYWFDIYLPKVFADIAIGKCLEFLKQIRKDDKK